MTRKAGMNAILLNATVCRNVPGSVIRRNGLVTEPDTEKQGACQRRIGWEERPRSGYSFANRSSERAARASAWLFSAQPARASGKASKAGM